MGTRPRVMLCLGLVCAAALVASMAQHRARQRDGDPSERTLTQVAVRTTTTSIAPGKISPAPTSIVRRRPVRDAATEEPTWLIEARDDPDPTVRLGVIEVWASDRGADLNPFTYALVDADETVRARAQELFEEALASR